MKLLKAAFLVFLAPGLILAQANTPKADSSTDPAAVAKELKAMREALAEQQKQVALQQQQIERLEEQLASQQNVSMENSSGAPRLIDAALHTGTARAAASPARNRSLSQDTEKESPLSFRIGGANFTPGGFVDFETVFRSTNSGSNISTNFGSIPFNNTIQGHLTELRMTGQYSRYNLKVTSKFGANDVTGYLEGDFNGNDAANTFVSTNSHTNRLRLYWVDLKRGKWEFLGGQSWSLMTANRVGLSPLPDDLQTTYAEDANTHVGVVHVRTAGFRAVYHANDHFQWGFGVENPEQFVGVGETIFPFAFNAQLGLQFDAGNNTATPNVAPDVLSKMAYDNEVNGKHFHLELGGLLTTVKITDVSNGPPTGDPFLKHSNVGGGIEGGFNLELIKNFHVVANGLYGPGIGRYAIGLGPQAVVLPVEVSPGVFDVKPSMVHAGTGLFGFEAQVTPKTLLAGYYGGAYFQRNTFSDITAPDRLFSISCAPGQPSTLKPCGGFGGTNSPNSANRAIQEATFDWVQTFWQNPQYGSLSLVTQYSYLTRSAWFVAPGAPKNAHLSMGFVSLRYVLP